MIAGDRTFILRAIGYFLWAIECVETTTVYRFVAAVENGNSASKRIEADQVTAIYLPPQDQNYFAVGRHPVACGNKYSISAITND